MKKLLTIILSLTLMCTLTGCYEHIEDTNGETNYNLTTLRDNEILAKSISSSGSSYEKIELLGITSERYYSKKFSGVEELFSTNYILDSDVGVYIGHMEVTSGNFRVCVINEGRILKDIPLDSFGETYYFEDINGEFSIRIAGESAAFDMYFNVE